MRALAKLLQPLILILALAFIAALVRSQWSQLQSHPWRLAPGWLILSGLVLVISWLVELSIWRALLARVGGRLPWPRAARIWFLSALVRYVPGNVWQPLGMTALARERGVRPEATVTSIALYQAINLLAVLPIALAYLLLEGSALGPLLGESRGWRLLAGGALLPIVVFLGRPAWLVTLVNWGLSRLGRPALPVRLTSRGILGLLAAALVDWLLWGLALTGLGLALNAFPLERVGVLLPYLLVSFPLAYAVGYLSFITPGGLAVREGALVLLLAPVLDGGAATLLALALRLWQVILELAAAGIVTLVIPGKTEVA